MKILSRVLECARGRSSVSVMEPRRLVLYDYIQAKEGERGTDSEIHYNKELNNPFILSLCAQASGRVRGLS